MVINMNNIYIQEMIQWKMKDEWNRSQQIYFLKLHFQVHSMYENSVIKMNLM